MNLIGRGLWLMGLFEHEFQVSFITGTGGEVGNSGFCFMVNA
jgi:hypothetical protein